MQEANDDSFLSLLQESHDLVAPGRRNIKDSRLTFSTLPVVTDAGKCLGIVLQFPGKLNASERLALKKLGISESKGNNPEGIVLCMDKSSWMASKAQRLLVEEIFKKKLKTKNENGDIIMHGCVSDSLGIHKDLEFINMQLDALVWVSYVPVGCTGYAQPLDRNFQGLFKHYFSMVSGMNMSGNALSIVEITKFTQAFIKYWNSNDNLEKLLREDFLIPGFSINTKEDQKHFLSDFVDFSSEIGEIGTSQLDESVRKLTGKEIKAMSCEEILRLKLKRGRKANILGIMKPSQLDKKSLDRIFNKLDAVNEEKNEEVEKQERFQFINERRKKAKRIARETYINFDWNASTQMETKVKEKKKVFDFVYKKVQESAKEYNQKVNQALKQEIAQRKNDNLEYFEDDETYERLRTAKLRGAYKSLGKKKSNSDLKTPTIAAAFQKVLVKKSLEEHQRQAEEEIRKINERERMSGARKRLALPASTSIQPQKKRSKIIHPSSKSSPEPNQIKPLTESNAKVQVKAPVQAPVLRPKIPIPRATEEEEDEDDEKEAEDIVSEQQPEDTHEKKEKQKKKQPNLFRYFEKKQK